MSVNDRAAHCDLVTELQPPVFEVNGHSELQRLRVDQLLSVTFSVTSDVY